MENARRERTLDKIFSFGLVLKAVSGACEVIGGLLVLLVSKSWILWVAEVATAGEIQKDPDDLAANTILNLAHSFAVHAHYFLAVYLLVHGAIKLAVVFMVFNKIRYAYHLFIVALGILSTYAAYRAVHTNNLVLGVVVVLDVVLVLLAAHEYRRTHSSQV